MNKLIVPVYLNQRMVFDQIAMLKGGISTVTSITHSESDRSSNQSGVSAEMGSGGVLSSLFRVNLAAKMTDTDNQHSGTESSENRVHTPASLFYELRNQLEEEEMLLSSLEEVPETGSFVEFKCQLNKNPFLESLESAIEIGNLTKMFSNSSTDRTQKRKQRRTPDRSQHQNPQENNITMEQTIEYVEKFKEMLTEGNTTDLVGLNINDSVSAVITLEDRFLNDPQMSDLIDGEFKVLGIVVKSIGESTDSISLIRKTTFNKLPPEFLGPLFEALETFQSTLKLSSTSVSVEIPGPAIQVLPVAIFA